MKKTLKLVWWASGLIWVGGCPQTVTVPNARVRGNAMVGNNATVGGDLNVGGEVNAPMGGNLGGLEVDGQGNVHIDGDLVIDGDITSSGNVSADDVVAEDIYTDNEPVVGPPGEIDHDDDPDTDPICPPHQRLCPDGTIVYRLPPDCAFEECPPVPVDNGNDNSNDNGNENDNSNDNGNENDNSNDNGNENDNSNDEFEPVTITRFVTNPNEFEPGELFNFELTVAGGDSAHHPHLFTCLFPDGTRLTDEDEGVAIEIVGDETDFSAGLSLFNEIDPDDFITATVPVYCRAMSGDEESLLATEFVRVIGYANSD